MKRKMKFKAYIFLALLFSVLILIISTSTVSADTNEQEKQPSDDKAEKQPDQARREGCGAYGCCGAIGVRSGCTKCCKQPPLKVDEEGNRLDGDHGGWEWHFGWDHGRGGGGGGWGWGGHGGGGGGGGGWGGSGVVGDAWRGCRYGCCSFNKYSRKGGCNCCATPTEAIALMENGPNP